MVSSLLHVLPPITPRKSLSNARTTATTGVIITTSTAAQLSDDDEVLMMNEKHTLPIPISHRQQRPLMSSSFRDADPFVHSMQGIRDIASAFSTSVGVAQSVRDSISVLLFKPNIMPQEYNVLTQQANVDGDHHRPSKSQHHHSKPLVSSKSTPISQWPSCVAPAIPPRRRVASSSSISSNSNRAIRNMDSRIVSTSGDNVHILAAQQKRPGWTVDHAHIRSTRVNQNEFRMLATENNMIRNAKITRPLRNRRFLDKRQDQFFWGRRSCLSIYDNGAGDNNKQTQRP